MGAQGPLEPGAKFGRYEIVRLLGRGGMGCVYEARDERGQAVALKVVWKEMASDPNIRARFEKETSAAVEHRNVARVIESGNQDALPFLVMELLPGGTLGDRLKREGRLPWQEAVRLGAQIASALAAVHRRNLVHRDLKPANVLLDQQGDVKLGDFGVVRTEASGLTKTGELLGTPQYMAPEQVEGSKRVDHRADLYSLGATLYALVTGKPPFDGPGYVVISRKLKDEPSSASSEVDGLPAALDELIARLLERDPAKRPESALLVSRELYAIATGKKGGVRLSVRWAGALAALGAVVAVGLAAALRIGPFAGPTPPPPPPPPPPAEKLAIVLDSPAAPIVSGDAVTVAGRAKGATSVEIDKASVLVGPGGSFEKRLPIAGTELTFTVVAKAGETRATETRTVYRPPEWFLALDEHRRPKLPLPRGLELGAGPGEYRNAKDESVLVYVPEATFEMGGSGSALGARGKQQPAHTVELSAYFIGKCEVSVGQFERFTKEKRYRTRAETAGGGLTFSITTDTKVLAHVNATKGIYWKYPLRPEPGQEAYPGHPATLIGPRDADEYCSWAGLVLPTEAQWERAASWDEKTHTKRAFPWGNQVPTKPGLLQAATESFMAGMGARDTGGGFPNETRSDAPSTVPVDANPDGASPVGALNMAGNVSEWCRDELDAGFYAVCLARGPLKDPFRPPSGRMRVHRGGHFGSLVDEVRTERRFFEDATYYGAADTIGFRVCRELDP